MIGKDLLSAKKELYGLEEAPPLGVVPKKMYAYVVRPDNHGVPSKAFVEEVVPVPPVKYNEVLIKVKAAGVNYNGIWAALGQPVSPTAFHKQDFHIAGSDASGIIWKLGEGLVNNEEFKFKVGD